MTIKGMNGETYDVTGSGQGIFNTIGASAGILSLLNNRGGILGGILGAPANAGVCSDNTPVSRYEAQQMISLASKDAEIANLKADQATDKKLVEVYSQLASQDSRMRDRIDAMAKELGDKITLERETRLLNEKEQAVFNQSMIGTTSTLSSQVQQLSRIVGDITTNVVPSRKVCDTGCNCQ